MPIERRWLTASEAAERLGVSRKRIFNLVAERRIPFSHPPGVGLRIDIKGTEELFEKNMILPIALNNRIPKKTARKSA
jgi:excisionase family DNA binding protein